MKTILFPTDFTKSTTPALDWARLLARHYKATLVLLHVQTLIPPGGTLPIAGDLGVGAGVGVDIPDDEPILRDQLAALASGLQNDGITCQTDLRRGAVTDVILAAADDCNADLVITGRSDLSTFFDRLLGTAATDVARGAHCPVLVVPSADIDETERSVQLRTIVFSTPLEFDQNEVFKQVVELARTVGASLRVLHVRADNQPNLTDDAQMIGQLQTVYGAEPLPVDTVETRTVSGGIETYLETHAADLLVMTTRERDFLSGLLNPSLTGRVLTSAKIPVLVYQAKGDL